VSEPEQAAAAASASFAEALRLAICAADIVELAACRGTADTLKAALRAQGVELPSFGRVMADGERLVLSVRPDRWLLLSAPRSQAGAPPIGAAQVDADGHGPDHAWQAVIGPAGAAIDQSSGLSLLWLAGAAWREVLARGCRLDLRSQVFADGIAAATTMAQVPVVILPRALSVLLLTPASTAQHLCEWLAATAAHDGFVRLPDLPFIHSLSKENS
jgi:heterotetrameric sarcosine oxidase gamma subunit